jgi:hypothetical protein
VSWTSSQAAAPVDDCARKEELSWTPNGLSNSQLDRRDKARTHVPYVKLYHYCVRAQSQKQARNGVTPSPIEILYICNGNLPSNSTLQ